jgi:hypothetical protein
MFVGVGDGCLLSRAILQGNSSSESDRGSYRIQGCCTEPSNGLLREHAVSLSSCRDESSAIPLESYLCWSNSLNRKFAHMQTLEALKTIEFQEKVDWLVLASFTTEKGPQNYKQPVTQRFLYTRVKRS